MKTNPTENRIRQRMAPGVLSRDGFLGHDARNIADIVAEDQAELDIAGVTLAEIADTLERIHEKADEGIERPVTLCGGAMTVQSTEGMWRMPCPFACGVRTHKAVITVQALGREFLLTPMLVHLVRAHGFFQGRGTPFRLEPADAAALWRLCRSSRTE